MLSIKTVPHLIFGLPGESRDMMLDSVRYISDTMFLIYISKFIPVRKYIKTALIPEVTVSAIKETIILAKNEPAIFLGDNRYSLDRKSVV